MFNVKILKQLIVQAKILLPLVLVSFYPGIDIGVQKRLLIYLFTATFCELEYYSKLVVFTFSHNLHSGDQKEAARNSSRKFRQAQTLG